MMHVNDSAPGDRRIVSGLAATFAGLMIAAVVFFFINPRSTGALVMFTGSGALLSFTLMYLLLLRANLRAGLKWVLLMVNLLTSGVLAYFVARILMGVIA